MIRFAHWWVPPVTNPGKEPGGDMTNSPYKGVIYELSQHPMVLSMNTRRYGPMKVLVGLAAYDSVGRVGDQ